MKTSWPRRLLAAFSKDRESTWTFALVAGGVYLAFLVYMHAHHEMWRDEVHAWTLSRLANGFWDLVTGDRSYEGHPPMWFWYLRVFTWFVKPAWGIQVATIAAALAAALLLLHFAPFPRFLKIMILFSYLFGFEYTVMSRNYVLGWLCVCIACASYHRLRPRHLLVGVALASAALTSFYGLVMSTFLLAYVVLDQTRARWQDDTRAALTLWMAPRTLITATIAAVGIVFCLLTVEPPEPNPFAAAFNWSAASLSALPEMAFRYTAALLPWRPFSVANYWCCDEYTFWGRQSAWVPYIGGTLFVMVLASLHRSWRLLLIYAGAIATMLLFQQVRHEGTPRHWGHFVVLFIAACWLLRTNSPRRSHWPSTVLLTAVIGVQLQPFAVATIMDQRHVFSGARDTAAFIEANHLQDLPLVAGPDFCVSTVMGYLRRTFIAVETDEINQTAVFHGRRRPFSDHELVKRAAELAKERKSPVLLVSNQTLPDAPAGTTRTQLFASRPGTIGDEVFWVYKLELTSGP